MCLFGFFLYEKQNRRVKKSGLKKKKTNRINSIRPGGSFPIVYNGGKIHCSWRMSVKNILLILFFFLNIFIINLTHEKGVY